MEFARIGWKALVVASAVGVVMSTAFCAACAAETVVVIVLIPPLYGLSIGSVMVLLRFSESRAAALAAFVWPVLLVVGLLFYAASVDAEIVRATGTSGLVGEIVQYILQVYGAGLVPAAAFLHLALLERSWSE